MTRLELLTVLYSLRALHKAGKPDAAYEVIEQIIAEAEADRKKSQSE